MKYRKNIYGGEFYKIIEGGDPLEYHKNVYGGEFWISYEKLSRVESPFDATKFLKSELLQSEQKLYKVGQLFVITKWGNCYSKVGRVLILQSGTTVITKWEGY